MLNAFKGRRQGKAVEVHHQWALSERGYYRDGSKIQILVRRSRGVEEYVRKYPFNKVTSEGNRKYMSLV